MQPDIEKFLHHEEHSYGASVGKKSTQVHKVLVKLKKATQAVEKNSELLIFPRAAFDRSLSQHMERGNWNNVPES